MNVLRSTFLTVLLLSQAATAMKMDETTHDQVIQRLELGLDGMDKNEPDRNGIILRVAELYADRARLKAINEVEKNCQECKGALNDRKKSISLYQEALPKAPKAEQGNLVLQIAHLYALNDEQKKANALYNQILTAKRKTYSSEVLAIAYANVGEIKFRNNDFKGALKDFKSARKENLKTRALIEFRIAWCELNLGQNNEAIKTLVHLLKDPSLMATQSTDGKNVDPSFVQDVSHDLAVFLAHAEVTPREIALLRSLSPDGSRKTNLHTLATETDRLGKKATALTVWAAYVDEGDVKPDEKLEVQTRVAQIYYDMNRQSQAAASFEKAADLWIKMGCADASACEDLKARMRKFVMNWNKSQKLKPTPELLRVYVAYDKVFPTDTEMLYWAGIVARDSKQPKAAAELFHRASVQANLDLKKTPDKKDLRSMYESSLLAEIEMAEASKDPKAREQAYNYYLEVNPNGSQAFEVRYQRAQLYYAANRYQEAFSEFHYLASQPGTDHHDLKVKSADLALDCLVAMKDDKNLQVRSLEYARFFPERKTEYMKISRKATLTLVATNLKNDKSSDRSDYKASLAALAAVNMDGADDAEKIKFYKNKLVIAQKALELTVVEATATKLLAVRTLSAEDQEWTKAQQVWAAELELNFALAYRVSQSMKMADLSPADRELRLALLAELAGESPRRHQETYLRLSKNVRASNLVRVTLIKNSRSPWQELDKQLKFLKQTPDLLAEISLDTFATHRDFNKAEKLLHTTSIAKYAAGQTLQRQIDLKDFLAFDAKIRNQRVYGLSDATLQKTLKERLQLLSEAEKHAQFAMRKHDWTLQTLNLTEIARENRRTYKDILSLPTPRRLSAQDKIRYQQLLKAQSEPYLAKAEKIEGQLASMWAQTTSVQNLQAAYMTATPDLQKLYRAEIQPLAQNAPADAGNRLRNLLNTPYRRPSQKDIMTARRDLQNSPYDLDKAQHLRELESQDGKPAMVVYLDERISLLKKGKML